MKRPLHLLLATSSVLFVIFVMLVSACGNQNTDLLRPEKDEELSGGNSTVFDVSMNAFGQPAPILDAKQQTDFVVGNSFFKLNWVIAPASTTDRDGLGPLLNAQSCSACHLRDGRGLPPADGNTEPVGLLVRLSAKGMGPHGEPLGYGAYGGQLQNRAVLGLKPEAQVRVSYTEKVGQYADGTPFSLRVPTYTFLNPQWGNLDDALISPRLAQQIVGMGLLEAISETDLLAMADEFDKNSDGISGRPNYVWNEKEKKTELGRLGWKANQPTVEQQVAGAFLGDVGITSPIFQKHDLTPEQADLDKLPNGGQPEISNKLFEQVVLYTAALGVPARRNWQDKQVLAGKGLFLKNCAACHTPKLETGSSATIAAQANQIIYPYSDLLLHDMGPDLADNRPDFLATGQEWRTPPLWGIGLLETVNGKAFYLHDGRARTLEEAILWHGGEAQKAQKSFVGMPKRDREALIAFLKSL